MIEYIDIIPSDVYTDYYIKINKDSNSIIIKNCILYDGDKQTEVPDTEIPFEVIPYAQEFRLWTCNDGTLYLDETLESPPELDLRRDIIVSGYIPAGATIQDAELKCVRYVKGDSNGGQDNPEE